jgi:hypothetical protein
LIQAGLISALENGFPDEDIKHRKERFRIFRVVVHREPPADVVAAKRPFNRFVLSSLLSLDDALPETQRTAPIQLAQLKLDAYQDGRPAPSPPTASDDKPLTDVLIFDQFEEILTIDPANVEAKETFFQQLGAALRRWACWALFSIRDDYAASLNPYLRPIPNRFSSRFPLTFLNKAAAMEAIREPARDTVVTFEKAAVEKLVEDLLGPTVEPLHLQVVCKRLWQEQFDKGSKTIPPEAIKPGETVDEALADYYMNEVREAAERDFAMERRLREWIEDRLITRNHVRERVKQGEGTNAIAGNLIERLINVYLVQKEAGRSGAWYELAHDRLIAPIEKNNAEWRKDNLQPFQLRAVEWARGNQAPSFLLNAAELSRAEAWEETHAQELNELEREFLAKCRRAHRKMLRHQVRLEQRRRQHAALALLARLLHADTNEVPAIVRETAPYRRWLDPLLREAQVQAEKDHAHRKQLHTSLALLPADATQVDYLCERLLDAEPGEVLVLRDALFPHKQQLLDTLWAVVEAPGKGKQPRRLRAAAALAKYDPDSPRWAHVKGKVVTSMVAVQPFYLERWIKALWPIRATLLDSLSNVHRDPKRAPSERTVAMIILAEYAADRPFLLAELLLDSDEEQFPYLYPKLKEYGDAELILQDELNKPLEGIADPQAKERLAKRQANQLQSKCVSLFLPRLARDRDVHGDSARVRFAGLARDGRTWTTLVGA